MTTRYAVDTDALPESVVMRIREKLDFKKRIISFRANIDAELTKSEESIGDATLVKKCREYLASTNSRTRNVYFKGSASRARVANPKKPLAEKLLKQGFNAQTVADVIGVSRITICRWYKSYRSRGRPGHTSNIEVSNGVFMAGVERLCELQNPVIDIDILSMDDASLAVKDLAKRYGTTYEKLKTRAKILGKALEVAECL